MSSLLTIKNLTKRFNKESIPAIKNLNLKLYEGENLALMGESGSGKSTLGRLIAGLEIPTSGSIEINQKIVSSEEVFIAPEKRRVGMIFQDYALFPHLTVSKNIAFGLKKTSNRSEIVAELLELVGLEGLEKRYPHQLSGGQQQRVAVARSLAVKPNILILDEPFSNLDISLKKKVRDDVFFSLKKAKVTSIFITHDTEDALNISDKLLLIHKGEQVQFGCVNEVITNPINQLATQIISK